MSEYEDQPVPPDGNSRQDIKATASDFSEVVQAKIKELGNDNLPAVDPYQSSIGIAIELPFDYRIDGSGRLRFGKKFQTHHLLRDQVELVYAYREPRPDKPAIAEVHLNEFGERGGLQSRTSFHDINGLIKRRFSHFGTALFETYPDFTRPLTASECDALKLALADPVVNWHILTAHLQLTSEEASMTEASRADNQRSQAELRQRLEDIREAERRAWENARNVIIR